MGGREALSKLICDGQGRLFLFALNQHQGAMV